MSTPCLLRLLRHPLRGLVPVALFALVPSWSSGQVISVEVRDGVTRGDEYHADLRPADALESFRGVLASDSTRFDALWRAARECVNLGMLSEDDDEAREWYTAAVDFAERAVGVRPASARGHEWLAIALGRRALQVGPMDRVDLSERVRESAARAIELDPAAAGAHNVLGQWHAEIQRLGGLARFAAERLLGAETFRDASWSDAERHLRRAVELEPDAPIHRVALARVLVDVDRPDEAREQLRHAVDLPVTEPTDPVVLDEARTLLTELDRSRPRPQTGRPGDLSA